MYKYRNPPQPTPPQLDTNKNPRSNEPHRGDKNQPLDHGAPIGPTRLRLSNLLVEPVTSSSSKSSSDRPSKYPLKHILDTWRF